MPHQAQLSASPIPRQPVRIGSRFAPGYERTHDGELDVVIAKLPGFDRAPLAAREGGENDFLDVIVRRENAELADSAVPVGVVSKAYRLLPHTEAAGALRTALASLDLHPREMQAETHLSVYGARMALFARLPRRFDFDPGDGHPMALRVLCLNSVDGSSPLRILLGWYRFVCANGLAVGTTRAEWRLVHREGAMPADLAPMLRSGIELAGREQHAIRNWTTIAVPISRIAEFADERLAPAWGVLAAARFLHIAATGFDAQFAYPFERGAPSAKTMSPTRRVPGSPAPARTAWDACQALAWLAKDRRDQQERVARMMEIPELMQGMMGSG